MRYFLGISLLASASLAIPRERVRIFQFDPNATAAVPPDRQQEPSSPTMERLSALASRHLADFDQTFDSEISASAFAPARGLDRESKADIGRNDIDYPLTEVLIPGISKRTYTSKTTTTASSPSLDPTSTTTPISPNTTSESPQSSEAILFSGSSAPAQTGTMYTTTLPTSSSPHLGYSSQTTMTDEASAYWETVSRTHTPLPSSFSSESVTSSPAVSVQTVVSTYTLTVISLAKPTTSPAYSSEATTTTLSVYAPDSGTSSSTPTLTSTLNSDSETASETEHGSDDYVPSAKVTENTFDSESPTETQTYLVIVMPSTNESTSEDSSVSGSSLTNTTTSGCSESRSSQADISPTDTTIEPTTSIAESTPLSTQTDINSDETPPVTSASSTTQTRPSSSTSGLAYSADILPTSSTTTSISTTLLVSSSGSDSSTQSPSETTIAYVDDDPLSTLSLTPESEEDSSTTDVHSSTSGTYISITSEQSSESEDTQIDKAASTSTRPIHPTLSADYTATISIELLPIRVSASAAPRTSRSLDHHKPIYSLPPHPLRNIGHVAKPVQTEPYIPPHPTSVYTPLYTSGSTYYTTSYSSAHDQDSSYKVSRQHGHDHKHSRQHGRHSHGDHSSTSTTIYYPTSTYYFPSDEADGISQAMGFRNKAAFISAVRANITPTVEQ